MMSSQHLSMRTVQPRTSLFLTFALPCSMSTSMALVCDRWSGLATQCFFVGSRYTDIIDACILSAKDQAGASSRVVLFSVPGEMSRSVARDKTTLMGSFIDG